MRGFLGAQVNTPKVLHANQLITALCDGQNTSGMKMGKKGHQAVFGPAAVRPLIPSDFSPDVRIMLTLQKRHFTPQHGDPRAQLIFNANITIWYHSNKGHCASIGCVMPLVSFYRKRIKRAGEGGANERTHTHPYTVHKQASYNPNVWCSQHKSLISDCLM